MDARMAMAYLLGPISLALSGLYDRNNHRWTTERRLGDRTRRRVRHPVGQPRQDGQRDGTTFHGAAAAVHWLAHHRSVCRRRFHTARPRRQRPGKLMRCWVRRSKTTPIAMATATVSLRRARERQITGVCVLPSRHITGVCMPLLLSPGTTENSKGQEDKCVISCVEDGKDCRGRLQRQAGG